MGGNSLIVTVQAVPERMEWVSSEMLPKFSTLTPTVFQDVGHNGTEWSFKKMLQYEVQDFRLHLQDDVELHPNIEELAMKLTVEMSEKGIDVLSLFIPRMFKVPDGFERGFLPFIKNKTMEYSWLQATLFSRSFVSLMRSNVYVIENMQDDKFVLAVSKKHGIVPYAHFPSLVQHKIDQPSCAFEMKVQTKGRATKYYDSSFEM